MAVMPEPCMPVSISLLPSWSGGPANYIGRYYKEIVHTNCMLLHVYSRYIMTCYLRVSFGSSALQDPLVSKISRKSIELLKLHFKEDMTKDDWRLVLKLKKTFQID